MEIRLKTTKKYEILDITKEVEKVIPKDVKEGICVIYTPHATASIIINENWDPNICDDIIECLKKLIPEGIWRHDRVDKNAAAHIKSAILSPSEIVPIKDGKILLGTWQSIMFCEWDGPRDRKIIVQVIRCM